MNKSQLVNPPPSSVQEPLATWLVEEYYELFVSVCVIIAVSAVSQVARVILAKLFLPQSWIRVIANEFVATAELCVTCFELGVIAETYGISYYGLFYFFSSVWWAIAWTEAYACPTSHLEDYLIGDTDVGTAAVVSLVEILTGCLAFRLFVQPIWSWHAIQLHIEKWDGVCVADLSVTPIVGGLVEGGGTVIFSILSKRIAHSINSGTVTTIITSVLDTFLVVLAYDYSGGYFNPVLATSMQYGCDGASLIDHLIVYWAGGVLGTIIGFLANRLSQPTMIKED